MHMHNSPLLAETKIKSIIHIRKGGIMKRTSRERAYSYVLERDASIAAKFRWSFKGFWSEWYVVIYLECVFLAYRRSHRLG